MHDALGKRMKENYESRYRFLLPRRTYTLLRIDGRAFHTYTRGCIKPFDFGLMDDLAQTAKCLCEEIQGTVLGYCQSDEITLLLTDFGDEQTQSWFDGNVQKIASISASIATAHFNQLQLLKIVNLPASSRDISEMVASKKLAMFDSRVWTIPDPVEVENAIIWRQQDAVRNSIQMLARSLYSHSECFDKNQSELQEMIHQKGQNWNDVPTRAKRGTCIVEEQVAVPTPDGGVTYRNKFVVDTEIPIFTKNRRYLRDRIPLYEGGSWADDKEGPI